MSKATYSKLKIKPDFILLIAILSMIFLFTLSSADAQTDFYGVIRDSGGQVPQLNIAIGDFKVESGFFANDEKAKASELKSIIEKGLDFSLYFNVVRPDSSVMALIGEKDLSYDDWIFLGVEHLVGGELSSDGILYHFNLKITDIPRGKLIYRDELSASIDSVNQLSYKIVDKVIRILTGEKGISRSKIAFSVARKGSKELAICNWDGTDFHYLTANYSLNLFPASSPDGRSLYFTSFYRGNPDLYRLDLPTMIISPISARRGINSAAAISPDGNYIALTLTIDNNAELYLLDIQGRIIRRLTKSWGIESSPSFSPNGKEIVFSSDRSGSVQLYIIDIDGLNLRRLTYNGNYNDTPSWSPKGDRIAYASRERDGRFQIYTISITGESPTPLTSMGNNQDPCFSPDGLHICFTSDRNGANEVYVMDFNGGRQTKTTAVKGAFNPCWIPYYSNK